jgi:hypothetical protein
MGYICLETSYCQQLLQNFEKLVKSLKEYEDQIKNSNIALFKIIMWIFSGIFKVNCELVSPS